MTELAQLREQDQIVGTKKDGRWCGIRAAAKASGIPYGTLNNRVTRGMTLEEAVKLGPYRSLVVEAKASGISVWLLRKRVASGMSIDEAIAMGPPTREHRGRGVQIAKELGITRQAVNQRVKKFIAEGLTKAEAYERAASQRKAKKAT